MLYQASTAGFDIDLSQPQFCSANSLILFKTPDPFVFGGYRPVSVCNGAPDPNQNEFIFSLINLYDVPVTMYMFNAAANSDPFSFGSDISISIGTASGCSNLGANYQMPLNMGYATTEALNFLAGTADFNLMEVEIYQLDCKQF